MPESPFRQPDTLADYLHHGAKSLHAKFGIAYDGPPRHLDADEKQFRLACLIEEAVEYRDAESMVDELDALIDLLVFTAGTLERHGFPIREAFNAVMWANNQKELAGAASASKRDFAIDLVKPDGWTGPEQNLAALLMYYSRHIGEVGNG